MKKIILLLVILLFTNSAFAYDVPKNEEYYKSQIQNQRFLYSNRGFAGAIKMGNVPVVESFIKAGFDVNATQGGLPLTVFAIVGNQPSTLKPLLDAGANPNELYCGMPILFFAIDKKSSEAVQYLADHKVDVNNKYHGTTPLNYALAKKQTKTVEILLKAGAKPDEKAYKKVAKSKDEYLKDMFADAKGK